MNTFVTFETYIAMKIIKALFNFYINSSIHVALAVCALCAVTFVQEKFLVDFRFFGFVFFASITGYNFVKYAGIAKLHHLSLTSSLKSIQVFSLLSFCALAYFTVFMPKQILLAVCFLGLLTLLYALPIFPKERSLRTVSGLKIYIIALVWACVAGLLPYLYFELKVPHDAYVLTSQFALFVLIITLPFEIRDLNYDALSLGTIPQRVGVRNTKIIGLLLLIPFYFLEFFKYKFIAEQLIVNGILVVILSLFLAFANEKRSTYYTSFWVESIPIIWWLMVVFF